MHKDTVANLERLVAGSVRAPHLAVFDLAVDIVDYCWAPDANAIAITGRDRGTRAEALYVFWPRLKRQWRIDQLDYFVDYTVDWAPNARTLAFSRPEGVNSGDEVSKADLFLADVSDRSVCRLLGTDRRVERDPLWLSDSTLKCTVQRVDGDVVGTPQDRVLELSAVPPMRP